MLSGIAEQLRLPKLYRHTGDPPWFERARAFAVTAIWQCEVARRAWAGGASYCGRVISAWQSSCGIASQVRPTFRPPMFLRGDLTLIKNGAALDPLTACLP